MSPFVRATILLSAFLLLVSCGRLEAPRQDQPLHGLLPEERRVEAEAGGVVRTSFDFVNEGSRDVPVRAFTDARWLIVDEPTSVILPAWADARVDVSAECLSWTGTRSATVTIETVDDDPVRIEGRVHLTCRPEEEGEGDGSGGGSDADPGEDEPGSDGGSDDGGTGDDGTDRSEDEEPAEPDGEGDAGGEDDGGGEDEEDGDDGGASDPYDVTLRFHGPAPTASQERAFENAAARWSQVITRGHPDRQAAVQAGSCGGSHPEYHGPVDDLIVFAAVRSIDGPGRILAQAGYCRLDAGTGLPYVGLMEFDEADVADLEARGLFEATILHEMGHVLGIGTLWSRYGHLDPTCYADAPSSRFTGTEATRQHELSGGIGRPHVETNHGAGTACGHWDEDRYVNELMTGFIDHSMPLSAITVGSLRDLGYSVDLAAADAYRVPSRLRLQADEPGQRLVENLIAPAVVPD